MAVALVARRGATLVGAGIALGFAASSAVTGLLASTLNGVSPQDGATWALSAAAMIVTGLVAVLVPSLRASRVDPIVAIRME